MPEGMGEPSPSSELSSEEQTSGSPSVGSVEEGAGEGEPEAEGVVAPEQRRLLLLILGVGAGVLLLYILFGVTLLGLLPAPDGGKQGLRLLGNALYAAGPLLALAGVGLFALRLLRSGMEPGDLITRLMRPGIGALAIVGFSALVLLLINRQTSLPIDILEPPSVQGLTAPVSVTFGTESLRRILKNQGLFPRRYTWDFNGDGKTDAEKQEHEVTTVYRRKGAYTVELQILLSDGSMRSASTRIVVPDAVFSVTPPAPIIGEEVEFSIADLVTDPATVDRILWDFDGDDQDDTESTGKELAVMHTYGEVGTYQVRAIIQNLSGLQETYVRPVVVMSEREQPFAVEIVAEGALQGPAPLGVLFRAVVEDGVRVREIRWAFGESGRGRKGEELSGERVAYTFTNPGEFTATLTVSDTAGRVARTSKTITVLEPLLINDLLITGRPKPEGGKIEGIAPLEVRISAVTNMPFVTFRWEQENASKVFSTEKEYHGLYEEPGTFPLVLIAKDAQDRTQRFPLEVVVLPPKSRVVFTAVPSTGIAPLTVTFDASQSFIPDGRITGYAWTFGDVEGDEKQQLLGAQVTHRYEREGTYTVVVRALTEEEQSYEARKTIVVRAPTLDACVFPSRTIGDAPMGVRFDASCSTGNITTYLWDFGDGTTSEQNAPMQDHVFEAPGTYTVKLEIADGQGNFDDFSLTITTR